MVEIDFNRPEKEILIDLIRQNNDDKELQLDWVDIGVPVNIVPDEDMPRNTEVLLTMKPTSPLRGAKSYFYNRLDVNEFLFDGLVLPEHLTIPVGGESRKTQLAGKLSNILHILITPDMIVDEPIPLVPNPPALAYTTISLKPVNYAITGVVSVRLTR